MRGSRNRLRVVLRSSCCCCASRKYLYLVNIFQFYASDESSFDKIYINNIYVII